jgi:hypothetical protein
MIRGTTAQFKFKLPYSKDELEWITIEFWQPGNPNERLPIIKKKDHCSEANKNEICVSLSATETAVFSDRFKAKVQLRANPISGAPFGSRQRSFIVYPMADEIIDEDFIVDPDTPTTDDGWIILDGGNIDR